MATITKSDACPQEDVTFAFGPVTFSLTDAAPEFVTSDSDVISSAKAAEWLSVKEDVVAAADAAKIDLNDPHQNPAADHLSLSASPAAIAAANENEAAIRKLVTAELNVSGDGLTAGEALANSLAVMGVTSVALPTDSPAPASSPSPAPAPASSPSPAPAPEPSPSPSSSFSPSSTGASS